MESDVHLLPVLKKEQIRPSARLGLVSSTGGTFPLSANSLMEAAVSAAKIV